MSTRAIILCLFVFAEISTCCSGKINPALKIAIQAIVSNAESHLFVAILIIFSNLFLCQISFLSPMLLSICCLLKKLLRRQWLIETNKDSALSFFAKVIIVSMLFVTLNPSTIFVCSIVLFILQRTMSSVDLFTTHLQHGRISQSSYLGIPSIAHALCAINIKFCRRLFMILQTSMCFSILFSKYHSLRGA